MKSITTVIAISLFSLLPVTFVQGQGSPKSAASEKRPAPAGAGKRTDVYHVHFTKAALGKAVQLGDWLKTPNPNTPMPTHFIVLRHQDGDAWDYVVITHLGTRASVEAAGTAVPPGHREQLEKMLSEVPSAAGDTTAGNVLMQHLEGAAWTFLSIARYNFVGRLCHGREKRYSADHEEG